LFHDISVIGRQANYHRRPDLFAAPKSYPGKSMAREPASGFIGTLSILVGNTCDGAVWGQGAGPCPVANRVLPLFKKVRVTILWAERFWVMTLKTTESPTVAPVDLILRRLNPRVRLSQDTRSTHRSACALSSAEHEGSWGCLIGRRGRSKRPALPHQPCGLTPRPVKKQRCEKHLTQGLKPAPSRR